MVSLSTISLKTGSKIIKDSSRDQNRLQIMKINTLGPIFQGAKNVTNFGLHSDIGWSKNLLLMFLGKSTEHLLLV